jgi:hypothetical protein
MEEKFQTAFPEDGEPAGTLCFYGCGRPAKFGDMTAGFAQRANDPPRCASKMSDCPAIARTAIRAAKRDGRLGRRWRSRF